jgi:hypothetical protein
MERQPFIWDGREVWGTKDIIPIIREEIETVEDAEEFFAEFEKVAFNAEAEIGWIAFLSPPELAEDILDLFLVDSNSVPTYTFKDETKPAGFGSCLGFRIESYQPKKKIKKGSR